MKKKTGKSKKNKKSEDLMLLYDAVKEFFEARQSQAALFKNIGSPDKKVSDKEIRAALERKSAALKNMEAVFAAIVISTEFDENMEYDDFDDIN